MAIYQFRCKCGEEFQEMQSPHQEHRAPCPKCRKKAKMVFTSFSTRSGFTEGFDVAAGRHFNTDRQRNNFIAENQMRRIR